MMTRMSRRSLLWGLIVVLTLAAAVALVGRARPPASPIVAAPPAAPAPEPSPAVRTETVTLRRGDTLLRALGRLGVDRRASADLVHALRASGADLRRMRAQ